VPDDDEIIQAYERELAPTERPRRSSRGFWVIAGTMALIAIVVVVEIFVNKPLGDAISHAQFSLRGALAEAEDLRAATGSFAAADAAGLAEADPSRTYLGPEQPSTGLDVVSVAAAPAEWAGAVEVRPGACFYIRVEGEDDPRYGSGEICTGRAALQADEPRW
jgi:hypothetical protein